MRSTKLPSVTPVMFLLNSVQVFPPSCDNCTLPSSVPTHSTLASTGDSANAEISLKFDSPSLRERRISVLRTPASRMVSRLTLRVRSFVAVHVEPKSFDMSSLFAPRYTVPALCTEATIGAVQS